MTSKNKVIKDKGMIYFSLKIKLMQSIKNGKGLETF